MTGPADFRTLVDEALAELGDDALLPSALATAARRFLGADGGSFSVMALRLRVPLGASDPVSAVAERLQFTSGDGPCLRAIRDGVAVSASAADLQVEWPLLADAWSTGTPFRSAAALPLSVGSDVHAALNLFWKDEDGPSGLDVVAAATVVVDVQRRLALLRDPQANPDATAQTWQSSAGAQQRQRVWVALGVVMMTLALDAPDALARMRAYALVAGRPLDELVDRLIDEPDSAAELEP